MTGRERQQQIEALVGDVREVLAMARKDSAFLDGRDFDPDPHDLADRSLDALAARLSGLQDARIADRAELASARAQLEQRDAEFRPHFGLDELRELLKALRGSLMYVGPVGISEHASLTWRAAHKWVGRVESLIEEYEETEALAAVPAARTPADDTGCALAGCPGRSDGKCPNDYGMTCEALFPEPSNLADDPAREAVSADTPEEES